MSGTANTEGVAALLPSGTSMWSWPRRISGWAVFSVLLLYTSGFTVYFAIVAQQLGASFSPLALDVLFPFRSMFPVQVHEGKISFVDTDFLTLFIPIFFLATAWEWVMVFYVVPVEKRPMHPPRLNDSFTSFACAALNILSENVAIVYWSDYLTQSIWKFRITTAFDDATNVLAFWACFIAYDFVFYWYHRAGHYISWIWAHHVTHHSSENYDLSTGLRRNCFDFMTPGNLIIAFGLGFIFPPKLIPLMGQINLIYQFWLHTQLIPPFPMWVERIINTPALHRIHHTRNEDVLGKNMAGVLCLWDWMFGTLEFETDMCAARGKALHYGTVPPVNSWNPLWVNAHHFHHMLFVETRWRGLLAPFTHWTPPGGKCPAIGSRLNPRTKYDIDAPSPGLRSYATAQGVVVLALATLAYVMRGAGDSWLCSATALSCGEQGSAHTLQAALLFALILSGFAMASDLRTATTPRSVRRALVASGCFHVLVVFVAVAVYLLAARSVLILVAALGVYLPLQAALLLKLWRSPEAREPTKIAELLSS